MIYLFLILWGKELKNVPRWIKSLEECVFLGLFTSETQKLKRITKIITLTDNLFQEHFFYFHRNENYGATKALAYLRDKPIHFILKAWPQHCRHTNRVASSHLDVIVCLVALLVFFPGRNMFKICIKKEIKISLSFLVIRSQTKRKHQLWLRKSFLQLEGHKLSLLTQVLRVSGTSPFTGPTSTGLLGPRAW